MMKKQEWTKYPKTPEKAPKTSGRRVTILEDSQKKTIKVSEIPRPRLSLPLRANHQTDPMTP